jgi:hypothetical protein
MTARLDHLVLAVPDLVEGTQAVARALGVEPAPGGRHVGLGTANALLGLGAGAYLEVIGPDPDQPDPLEERPFGIDGITAATLVTWAARVSPMSAAQQAARDRGYDPGPARTMQRATPEGSLLSWSLTSPPLGYDGVVPFLIDWGATPHPSGRAPGGVVLESFVLEHDRPEPVRAALDALGLDVTVVESPVTALRAVLRGPGGTLTLGG